MVLDVRLARAGTALLLAIIVLLGIIPSIPMPRAIADGTNLSNTSGASANPRIAVDGDSIYTVWEDDSIPDVLFKRSTDSGVTFESAVNLSNSADASNNPKLAVDGSDIFVVWQDGSTPDILFKRSTDAGSTFDSEINISNSTGISTNPQIAVDNNVFVVWEDSSPGNVDVFLKRSSDSGGSFDSEINISNTAGASTNPQMAVNGDDVYIVWQDDTAGNLRILLAHSIDAGSTFGSPVELSASENAENPQIATSGNIVYVAWEAAKDIFFSASTDAGANFVSTNLSNNTGTSTTPQLAVDDGGNAYVSWGDDTSAPLGVYEILFRKITGGSTIGSEENLSNTDDYFSNYPQIAVSGSTVFVVWQDAFPDNDILLSASTDAGSTFTGAINVSDDSDLSSRPQVGASGNNVFAIWRDHSSEEIYFSGPVDYLDESISGTVSNANPKWGIDSVTVSGNATNNLVDDVVSVDWGDGSTPTEVSVTDGRWEASHIYDSSAVGNRTITATLLSSAEVEKATSDPKPITVQKHDTSLTLNQVPSAIAGSTVTASGSLADADAGGSAIGNATITFTGTGATATSLASDTTAPDGSFSLAGTASSTADTGWLVQAHFAGNALYEPSDSSVRSYDTIDPVAEEFAVPAGTDVEVNLAGFNTTVTFDDVAGAGSLFVSECAAPDSARYVALDGMCLTLSPTATLTDGSSFHVSMSFTNATLPTGYDAGDIDVFHNDAIAGTIVDVTESRDLDEQQVTGAATSFSEFIGGVAVHTPMPAGAVRQQIFVGNSEAFLRDITNIANATSTASLDADDYHIGDSPVATIVDPDANLDPFTKDTITADAESDSDPNGITFSLEETDIDTDTFVGSFTLVNGASSGTELHMEDGEDVKLNYESASGGRFKAAFEGISESGFAEMSDYVSPDNEEDFEAQDHQPFIPISGAVKLELIDAQLGDGGSITVTMSYANTLLEGSLPQNLDLYQWDGTQWCMISSEDIDLSCNIFPHDPSWHNETAKTITGKTNSAGIFVIGHPGSGGGAGGGLGKPGVGVVLDFVAQVAEVRRGGGGGGGGSATSTTSAGTNVQLDTPAGGDSITISSDADLSGDFTVDTSSITDMQEIFSSVDEEGRGEVTAAGHGYTAVGEVFDVEYSGTDLSGGIEVTVPYDESLLTEESDARLLHYDGSEWEDATVAIDTDANTVTGILHSLSPLVVGIAKDGTFAQAYIAANPLSRISVGNTEILRPVTGAGIEADAFGEEITVSQTIRNMQRVSQAYAVIVQIVDEEGFTRSLTWSTGLFAAGEEAQLEHSWVAERTESYEIQVFVWDGVERPQPLSRAAVQDFTG